MEQQQIDNVRQTDFLQVMFNQVGKDMFFFFLLTVYVMSYVGLGLGYMILFPNDANSIGFIVAFYALMVVSFVVSLYMFSIKKRSYNKYREAYPEIIKTPMTK